MLLNRSSCFFKNIFDTLMPLLYSQVNRPAELESSCSQAVCTGMLNCLSALGFAYIEYVNSGFRDRLCPVNSSYYFTDTKTLILIHCVYFQLLCILFRKS